MITTLQIVFVHLLSSYSFCLLSRSGLSLIFLPSHFCIQASECIQGKVPCPISTRLPILCHSVHTSVVSLLFYKYEGNNIHTLQSLEKSSSLPAQLHNYFINKIENIYKNLNLPLPILVFPFSTSRKFPYLSLPFFLSFFFLSLASLFFFFLHQRSMLPQAF